MRRSKIFDPAYMPAWWFVLSAFLLACFTVPLLIYCVWLLTSLAHADERPVDAWIPYERDATRPAAGTCTYGDVSWPARVDGTCHTDDAPRTAERQRWLRRYTIEHPRHCRLGDNPDDGLVSGPTPQVCARFTTDGECDYGVSVVIDGDGYCIGRPQRPSEPAGARPGLLDPTRPERSFAR